jgi:hypothetical protein
MTKIIRQAYLLIHTPTHIGRPLQMGFVEANTWSNSLFEKYKQSVEENEGRRSYLTKREIENWGFFPPCGARFEVIKIELPTFYDPRLCRCKQEPPLS